MTCWNTTGTLIFKGGISSTVVIKDLSGLVTKQPDLIRPTWSMMLVGGPFQATRFHDSMADRNYRGPLINNASQRPVRACKEANEIFPKSVQTNNQHNSNEFVKYLKYCSINHWLKKLKLRSIYHVINFFLGWLCMYVYTCHWREELENANLATQMKGNTIAWINLGCYAFKTGCDQVI